METNPLFRLYRNLYFNITANWPVGTNVFDREWDALVLLDTCRVDGLREVAPEYNFLDKNDIGSIISVGSTSPEWTAKTFVSEYIDEIRNTVYVSGNGYSEYVLKDRDFTFSNSPLFFAEWDTVQAAELQTLDQPWQYAPEPVSGKLRPDVLTDRAIAHSRDRDPDRLIVHYIQPHHPYTAVADAEGREELTDIEKNPFEYLKNGGDRETVWELYLETLRQALDSVELLLQNIDANRVAISADHGEAFGEFGFYNHPAGAPIPQIKRVPWTVTSATDSGEYTPSVDTSSAQKSVSEHLEDLGYL